MTEKIEWYREVLELEPNSKVFLPLAKLLVEENEDARALEILRHGLERHQDFLEARLYLIELLYKTGKKDECDAEVKKLGKMFATYAGFWQAWAACLSGDNEQDTASVLRFLAATFLHGPLSLHEVLNRGLASYMPDARLSAPRARPQSLAGPASVEAMPGAAQETEEETAAESAATAVVEGAEAGQMDIERANNEALGEIMQPVEEAAREAAPAETETVEAETAETGEVEESAQTRSADNLPEQETEETQVAKTPVEAAQPEETPVEAAQIETQPAEKPVEAAVEMQAAPEEATPEEAAPEQPAVEESVEESAAMAEEIPPLPEAEEDMVSNAAEVEADSGGAITEEPLPPVEEAPECAVAEGIPAETLAAETAQGEAQSVKMPQEPVVESLVSTEPTPGEIREAAIAEQAEAVEDDVVGTGGESLQTIFEENIAPGNPEMQPAAQTVYMEDENADLPAVENADLPVVVPAQPVATNGGQADELGADEYRPKFRDSSDQYTVRTRSMAEVLAEQDDLQGALEIYRELLAGAPEGAEKNDLQQRISTLTQKLRETEEAAPEPVEYVPGSVSSRSREKLISMLEALAKRVEARAQN